MVVERIPIYFLEITFYHIYLYKFMCTASDTQRRMENCGLDWSFKVRRTHLGKISEGSHLMTSTIAHALEKKCSLRNLSGFIYFVPYIHMGGKPDGPQFLLLIIYFECVQVSTACKISIKTGIALLAGY